MDRPTVFKSFVCTAVILLSIQGCKRSTKQRQIYEHNAVFGANTLDELRAPVQYQNTLSFAKDTKQPKKAKHAQQSFSAISIQEQEARLVDIPIPLGAKATGHTMQEDTQQRALYYAVSLPSAQLIEWYRHEMERWGWHEAALIYGKETVIMFEKPQRFCTVVIHTKDRKKGKSPVGCHITLYIGIKKQALT